MSGRCGWWSATFNGSVAKVEQAGALLKSEHSLEIVADIAATTRDRSLAGRQVLQQLRAVAQMAEESSSDTAPNRLAAAEPGQMVNTRMASSSLPDMALRATVAFSEACEW